MTILRILKIAALPLLLSAVSASHASWPVTAGGQLADAAIDVKVGPSGSVYVTGSFSGVGVLDDLNLNSRGLDDVYIAKLSPGGSVLWVQTGGGESSDTPSALALDEAENVYVAGRFFGQANFGGTNVGDGGSDADGFVIKLSAGGEWGWARSFGGTGNDFATAIGVIPGRGSGTDFTPASIMVGGSYQCSASYAGGTINSSSHPSNCNDDTRDVFVGHISNTGSWKYAIGPANPDRRIEQIDFLKAAPDGSVYMGGQRSTVGWVQLAAMNGPAGTLNGFTESGHAGRTGRARYPNGSGGFYWFTRYGESDYFMPSTLSNGSRYARGTASLKAIRGSEQVVSQTFCKIFFFTCLEYETTTTRYSEKPDFSEDLALQYQAPNGNWQTIHRLQGRFAAGETIVREIDIPGSVFYDGVRFRIRQTGGSGNPFDWWHIENLSISAIGKSRPFLRILSNAQTDTGGDVSFGSIKELPLNTSIRDLELSFDNSELLLAGSSSASTSYCGQSLSGSFLAWVNPTTLNCKYARSLAAQADIEAIAGAPDGSTYITGLFQNSLTFFSGADGTISSSGSTDVFVAAYGPPPAGSDTRNPVWISGGNRYDSTDGVPGRAGGSLVDAPTSIVHDGGQNLYVTGQFEDAITFGEAQLGISAGSHDGFIGKLSDAGVWFQISGWTVGVPVPPPGEAVLSNVALQPEFLVDGQPFDAIGNDWFYWAPPGGSRDAALIPLVEIESIEILWRTSTDFQSTDREPQLGAALYPTDPCDDASRSGCFQVHVAGAPVEIQPDDNRVTFMRSVGAGSVDDNEKIFSSSASGFTALIYVDGPAPDEVTHAGFVQMVRTLPFNAAPLFEANVPAQIGQKLSEPYHDEVGRAGFVINALAYYDGSGANAAYNRASRTGIIVPVNRVLATRAQDAGRELAVAWYHQKATGVYWPEKPVSYAPFWPLDPDRIVVTSQQGSENLGQQILDPLQFEQLQIYQQDNPDLPGFNPNDEHAFFAPSQTGTGKEALFALRADFGSNLLDDGDAPSDPYVLVKYFDGEWVYRVYHVLGTGAGFTGFQFSGFAGVPVTPPYPLSILPGCADTRVVGQASTDPQPPPPFFMDYKNALWGVSAGSGQVKYYYPLQPGFYWEEATTADGCVPLLARLPEAQGGTPNPADPILAHYTLDWPDQTPQLVPGETLLTPKKELPDIFNQAAIEIAYDGVRDAPGNTDPLQSAAKLIDPLNPRNVSLDALPGSVASELDPATGWRIIISNDSGTIKLPVSIRDRLRFDPLNGRLIWRGRFDESGAGEPLLLLNIMSIRERDLLLSIDASADPAWTAAVHQLFFLTRNPNGITKICESPGLQDGQRVCLTSPRGIRETDILADVQDTNNDGVLEPFQAVGVKPALTAGYSNGNGFMTLVFNNDPSLSPLPVSVEIIRVDCLDLPSSVGSNIAGTYQGQLQIMAPENIFDEQLVLRHSGDFGGNPDDVEFEWYYHPDIDGTPPMPLPEPETGQLNGWLKFPTNPRGDVEISIEGANIVTLSDNWYVARYRGLSQCSNSSNWSLYAGQPGATPLSIRAQLAEGWVKRVLKRLNPFEARVQDFASAATNNFSSMLVQLGERYEGPIALNNDPANLNNLGLIEAYTTVFRRAMDLSVNAVPPVNYDPANTAILLVASRLVDFYTLLGNEAYSDAQDPTVGLQTSSGFASLAPAIFNFQNQLSNLLEEELTLLRGRDESKGPVAASPVYNRLFWNFTTGDGEVAYSQSYNISDVNLDGVIDEFDARIQYPQGHGDAWGHYLTAADIYYDLLRHPFYTWNPRAEAITVAGTPISVDFLDERQFAETAVARARTGSEIVDLTYRREYVDDPNGQFQGYKDRDNQRAWGLSEWGRRAGHAAYFDWVTVNSILQVEEPDPDKTGIQRVDRTTVDALDEIQSYHLAIQLQVDEADRGLNPLGLATGVVPFDIDPIQLDRFGQTHFQQVYDRAATALDNAVQVWDFANSLNRMLRNNEETVEDLAANARATEVDLKNRLIEIFGYPYADDIGPGGLYPAEYDGPDLYHYMFIDANELEGTYFDLDGCPPDDTTCTAAPLEPAEIKRFKGEYAPSANGFNYFNITSQDDFDAECNTVFDNCSIGDTSGNDLIEVEYTTMESELTGFTFIKPPEWSSVRRAPGKLQNVQSQMIQAKINLQRAFRQYENLRKDITDALDTIEATLDIRQEQISIAKNERNTLVGLTATVETLKAASTVVKTVGKAISGGFKTAKECVPKSVIVGLSGGGDVLSAVRCTIKGGETAKDAVADTIADGIDIAASAVDASKADVSAGAALESRIQDVRLELFDQKGAIDAMLRKEPLLRAEIYQKAQTILDLQGQYQASLAEGQRLLQSLIRFRKRGAAEIQEHRYQDMAFRIFRNDSLQKYRAAFEQAARFVYLAASAYDYETNLLGTDAQAGQGFLTDIVRHRSLGQILNGTPLAGSRGLADPMARMSANFEVLKGQMGFSNPQTETNRFSLRRELFRIDDGAAGDAQWRTVLEEARVPDLWQVPEYRRFARPFAPESAGPQPGLVIRFPTTVSFGLNYFGWELGPGDSSYDPSNFATKIRTSGLWFDGYDQLPLSNTPRIYLFPVGADVLRAAGGDNFETREWTVIDQVIPVPFAIGAQDFSDPDWLPSDNLIGDGTQIRRFSRFRAYNYVEPFDASQLSTDSRLIGRSVWNREWLLIIPGEAFLFDAEEGLDTFIHGEEIPGTDERDGQGVSDIYLFFQTYAYSGN